jgi:hypothetical protein
MGHVTGNGLSRFGGRDRDGDGDGDRLLEYLTALGGTMPRALLLALIISTLQTIHRPPTSSKNPRRGRHFLRLELARLPLSGF